LSLFLFYEQRIEGDAYCVASGVPVKIDDEHVREIAMIALTQREVRESPF
jgi:hypothetical protein